MFTKRRVTAVVAALASGITWVVLVSPGDAGRAAPPVGTTARASVADDGSQSQYGGGDSEVSGDGRFDIFTSYSSLPSGPGNGTHPDDGDSDCNCQDPNSAIYVRDLVTGHTSQVSIGFTQGDGPSVPMRVDQPDGNSFSPSISEDGRYISFVTNADNIVPTDEGANSTIVVCDRGTPNKTGGIAATRGEGAVYPAYFQCISVAGSRASIPTGVPHLDGPGDQIAWIETNLRSQSANFGTVGYVATLYDMDFSGDDNGVLRAPTGADIKAVPDTIAGYPNTVQPREIEIAYDGDWVVYAASPNEESGAPSATSVIGEWNSQSTDAAERVDEYPGGGFIGNDNVDVAHPAVSADGTTVVFDSVDEVYGYNTYTSYPDVYAVTVNTNKFSMTGAPNVVTSSVVVSRLPDGTVAGAGGDGAYPTVSGDGRYVAFVTDRDGMFNTPTYMPGEDGGYSSCLSSSGQTNPPSGGDDRNVASPRSANAVSAAPDPTTGGSSASSGPQRAAKNHPAAFPPTPSGGGSLGGQRTPCQIAVRDLIADRATVKQKLPFVFAHLASPSRLDSCEPGRGQECLGDNDSENPVSLSYDGGQVGFDSAADDLVPNDTNAPEDGGPVNDAFVRTWTPTLKQVSVDFGNVKLGYSSARSFYLRVSGFGPIEIGEMDIGGSDPGDFSVDSGCIYEAVHAGEPCEVYVTFAPQASGPRSGTAIIQPRHEPGDPPIGPPIIIIPLSGNGSNTPPKHPTPQFSADPSTVYFGSDIPLHNPGRTRIVTITNPGSGTLVLTNVSIIDATTPGSGSDFTITGPPCSSIPPGGSCTLTVTFVGRAVGVRDGVLRIADNTGSAPHQIMLGGRIRGPKITVNPAVSPTGRVVTVTGTGFAPKRVVDVGFAQSGEEAKVKADRTGGFSVGLVIFPNANEGPRTITSRTLKVSPTISANSPLLVVLGTLESPTLVNRH